MAGPYVTGPVNIYVSPNPANWNKSGSGTQSGIFGIYPSAGSILYLGTCDVPPRTILNPRWRQIFASIGGEQVPFDFCFEGEDGQTMGVLNRWNESVYKLCAARPKHPSSGRGALTATDIGTLMIAEAYAYSVWLHFPYYSKLLYGTSYAEMPAGYRFPGSFMIGPDGIEGGTRASKRAFIFQHCRIYKPTDGTWTLYDHIMQSIPTVPPNNFTGAVT